MKARNRNPLWFLILVVALAAGVFLVQKNANTQRKAYFSGAKLLIQPVKITAAVGEEVPVQLWVQTDVVSGSSDQAKVSSVDTSFCYGSQLSLETDNPTSAVTLNSEAFGSLEYVKNENNCLRLVVVSGGIAPENLKSGMVKIAGIKFKAVAPGNGTLALDMAKSVVAGYNPAAGATDMTMKIGSVENAAYEISETGAGVGSSTTSVGEKIMMFIKNLLGIK
jgi:hypothetical protein